MTEDEFIGIQEAARQQIKHCKTPEQRAAMKEYYYNIMYGQSPERITRILNINFNQRSGGSN